MKTTEMLKNVLFTSVCCFCGEVCAYDRAACPGCLEQLAPVAGITCAVCGMERPFCGCAREPCEYERCAASFYYEGPAMQGVRLLKYADVAYIARYHSLYMARTVRQRFEGVRFDAVVCVPMHRLKRRERGYNQAEALARGLARRLRIPLYANAMVQCRQNEPQHLQRREQREQNVRGIYALSRKRSLRGKTLLLADDITTTGATLRECARVLKKGGAKEVYCIVFCATKPINA